MPDTPQDRVRSTERAPKVARPDKNCASIGLPSSGPSLRWGRILPGIGRLEVLFADRFDAIIFCSVDIERVRRDAAITKVQRSRKDLAGQRARRIPRVPHSHGRHISTAPDRRSPSSAAGKAGKSQGSALGQKRVQDRGANDRPVVAEDQIAAVVFPGGRLGDRNRRRIRSPRPRPPGVWMQATSAVEVLPAGAVTVVVSRLSPKSVRWPNPVGTSAFGRVGGCQRDVLEPDPKVP